MWCIIIIVNRWRLKANVSKSAAMVFARNQEEGEWMWGKVIDSVRTMLSISINLSALRMLLLAVVRPSLEYGNEVWECNKGQANALECIILGVLRRFRVVLPECATKTGAVGIRFIVDVWESRKLRL